MITKEKPYIDWISTGKNVKELMKEKNISTKELAEKLEVSSQTICYYLKGKRAPNLVHIVNIAFALNVSIDSLIIPSDHSIKIIR